jgi:hypothetical protein
MRLSVGAAAQAAASGAGDVLAGLALWLLRFEAGPSTPRRDSTAARPRWFSGTVTWQRVVLVRDRVDASVLPSWAVGELTNRSFHTVAAKLIIATELFIAADRCAEPAMRRCGWRLLPCRVELSMKSGVLVPRHCRAGHLGSTVDRDNVLLLDPASRRNVAAPVVHGLDWLARFRSSGGRAGVLAAVDRDGRGRGRMGGAVRSAGYR